MFPNRLAFAALAVACVAAAAIGGYVASRQHTSPIVARTAGVTSPAPDAETTDRPVQETEAVLGDAAAKPAAAVEAPAARQSAGAARPSGKPTASRAAAAPTGERASRAASGEGTRQNAMPTLERTWPSGAANNAGPAETAQTSAVPPTAAPSSAPPETAAPAPRAEERAAAESPGAPEPPEKTLEELVVGADSVLGLQTETPITSERARVEDRIEARVTRDVRVIDRVAIPAGARAIGSVTLVERGGKFKERARLGIRFHTLVLADGTQLPITTETIFRDGTPPGNEAAKKVGAAAVGGAILGAILGGSKGAAIGAMSGAGAGTAAVVAGDRGAATLPAGSALTVRLQTPISVTIER